tara:strand:+ start:1572 stop:1892 length:321 start_codon:yes stop_codon:yes gene_type:complete
MTVKIKNQINRGHTINIAETIFTLLASFSVALETRESENHLMELSRGIKLEPSSNSNALETPEIGRLVFTELFSVSRSRSPSSEKTFIADSLISTFAGHVFAELAK